MAAGTATWVVVLIKDFETAKSRLAGVLSAAERSDLARSNARRALEAARAVGPALAVCGSAEAAEMATQCGVVAVTEPAAQGQNPAAARGLAEVAARGGDAALLLSADLPLVTAAAIRALIDHAATVPDSLVVAAPALGRGGTNALYLRPVEGFTLQFGDASLERFAAEAARRRRRFVVYEDDALALDLDEPSDLAAWTAMRAGV